MDYDPNKKVSVQVLKEATERIKTEMQEMLDEAAAEDVATSDEVAEMLDEVFGAAEEETPAAE